MVLASPGGGGSSDVPAGAISGQIEITIDAIRRIARDNMAAMQDNANAQAADFRSLSLTPSAFSDVPIGQTVGQQHQAAHEVFVSTIDGVIADLQNFAANLEASCNAHEATDEQSAADAQRAGQGVLSGATESMGAYQSQADTNFDNAGAERRDELGEMTEEDQREGDGESGGPEVAPTRDDVHSALPPEHDGAAGFTGGSDDAGFGGAAETADSSSLDAPDPVITTKAE